MDSQHREQTVDVMRSNELLSPSTLVSCPATKSEGKIEGLRYL
jgi:hypothetical protein